MQDWKMGWVQQKNTVVVTVGYKAGLFCEGGYKFVCAIKDERKLLKINTFS